MRIDSANGGRQQVQQMDELRRQQQQMMVELARAQQASQQAQLRLQTFVDRFETARGEPAKVEAPRRHKKKGLFSKLEHFFKKLLGEPRRGDNGVGNGGTQGVGSLDTVAGPDATASGGTFGSPGKVRADGTIVAFDLLEVPRWMGENGYSARDNAQWYVFSRSYDDGFRDRWDAGSDPESIALSDRRNAIGELGAEHVKRAYEAWVAGGRTGRIQLLENDDHDRCGDLVARQARKQLEGLGVPSNLIDDGEIHQE